MANLIRTTLIDLRVKFSRLKRIYRLFKLLNRCCDPRGDEAVDDNQDKEEKCENKDQKQICFDHIERDSVLRRHPDNPPSRISDALNRDLPLSLEIRFPVSSIPVGGCRLKVLLHNPRLDQLHLRMVNQLPSASDHVEIPLVSECDVIKQLLKTAVADIEKQNTLLRRRSPRDLDCTGDCDHPAILIFTVIKNVLHMRNCKVHIICPLKRLLKPVLLRHIKVRL